MKFEGKICGMCNKGILHGVKDEVEKGITVEAYKCNSCGEIAYSKEVMEKVEAMYRDKAEERSLIKIGASLAVSIPKEIVDRLKLRAKEKVYITSNGNEIIARVAPI